MLVLICETVVNAVLPSRYYVHALVRAFAQGRTTNSERDMHARVVLLTAHIIALSPKPVQDPEVEILINLLQSTTKNDQIFADEYDLTCASFVRSFCSRFRYQQLGSIIGRQDPAILTQKRQNASLASFLILTLSKPPPPSSPLFHQEGWRSLQMVIFTRHLQRVLDALPSGGQIPKTDNSTIHVVSDKVQKYMLLQSFLRLLTKSTTSALSDTRQGTDAPEEVLKAGSLYRECAVVNLRISSLVTADAADAQVPDDGELGGVHLGQALWGGS
ncbi:hypothetical protein EV702DRAFT_1180734 [Suillus placidus]|uniref:Uncharacterized protein n=1 Tax=Suillus placidus TaxID=48579 RepID=A0A9P6ZQV6_9AGAM|nr:hypothetical protein EV702DRAFT_1180734 [Suillus placidus]